MTPDSATAAAEPIGHHDSGLAGWANSPRLTVAALTAVGLLLRLLFLGKSFWEAEGESIAIVHGNQAAGTWSAFGHVLWAREFNMALYYVLLRVWLHLGNSEFFIRLLSVIPGVATIAVVYALGKRLCGHKVALTAALLLTIHGTHVAYSQEARSYALLVLLCTVSYLCFVLAIETSAVKYWLLYILFSALAVYAHFFAFLMLPAQLAALLWLPRAQIPWKRLLSSMAAIALLIAPAAMFILTKNVGQLSEIHSTWGRLPNLISTFAGTGAAVPVCLVLWGFALWSWVRSGMISSRSQTAWHRALLMNWLALPVLLALLACLKKPILETRYLLFCVSASVIVAAWGLFEIPGHWRLSVAVITVILSFTGVIYTYAKPKDDWRGASKYVLSHAQSGDVVTVVPPASRWTFDYYLNRRAVSGLSYSFPEPEDAAAWVAKVPIHGRVWVISHNKGALPSARAANHAYDELNAALTPRFHLQERIPFNMGAVELYEETPAH